MKKYSNFILESKNSNDSDNYIKNITLDDAIKLFKLTPLYETYKKIGVKELLKEENNRLIYRVVKDLVYVGEDSDEVNNDYDNYCIVEPDSITRRSPYSATNMYNLLFSNLPSWNDLPKRDNSLICGDFVCVNNRSRK